MTLLIKSTKVQFIIKKQEWYVVTLTGRAVTNIACYLVNSRWSEERGNDYFWNPERGPPIINADRKENCRMQKHATDDALSDNYCVASTTSCTMEYNDNYNDNHTISFGHIFTSNIIYSLSDKSNY